MLLLRAFASASRIKLPMAWAVSGLDFGSMSDALEQNPANLIWCHLMKQDLFFNSAEVNGKTFDKCVKAAAKSGTVIRWLILLFLHVLLQRSEEL